MRSVTNLRVAVMVSILIGVYTFSLLYRSSAALGIAMSLGIGITTFALMRFRSVQRVRHIYLVSYAILVWTGFYAIFDYIGIENLSIWGLHIPS